MSASLRMDGCGDGREIGAPASGAPSTADELRADVLRGLSAEPKTLPAKLFYDEAGARLFEQICELDEYYLTRAELTILRAHAGDIARIAGPESAVIEYGSGAGTKTRVLLDALRHPASYTPIDISVEQLARVARELRQAYPKLRVVPLCADYTRPLHLPEPLGDGRRLAFFPGSTIGNFHPPEASAFLGRIRRSLGPDGALVLGVDRRKDADVLNAAYDDASGVTAAFNLNLLRRLNREVGADFDVSRFHHRAFFNETASRVEMHLVSATAQTVRIDGNAIRFDSGETIWTESSYKYDRPRLAAMVDAAGFEIAHLWTDDRAQFWVGVLVAGD